MSRCTADLEYLQCDLCNTYFHKDIFCPHRRECKGAGSVELKKNEAAALLQQLNKLEDADRRAELNAAARAGGGENAGEPNQVLLVSRAGLDQQRAKSESQARTQLANDVEKVREEEIRKKINKQSLAAALDFLDS